MQVRHVPLSTLYKISRKPFSLLGLIFSLASLFILFPLVAFLTSSDEIQGNKYDYDAIYEKGIEKGAQVTAINPLDNISINGRNPLIIAYRYDDHGLSTQDRFQTMDLESANALQTGDSIKIKQYKGQTAIANMEPFRFPAFVFYILPVIFLTLGIIFLLIGFLPALKKFRLLKSGRITDATLVSLVPTGGMPISGNGKVVNVYYYYFDKGGRKLFGEDTTTDFSILAFYKPEDSIRIVTDENDASASCLLPAAFTN